MTKPFLALTGLTFAILTSGTAVATPRYVAECARAARPKLEAAAAARGVALDPDFEPEVCGIDARWYNPSRYVWFCATADGVRLSVLTQKPLLPPGKCF